MSAIPRVVANYACRVAENPLWHPAEKRYYWTDILSGRLFWYEPSTGIHRQCYQGRPVGGFTFQADGGMLLFMDRGTIAIWKNGTVTPIVDEIPEVRDTRFNDVIADPRGRVFCGTIGTDSELGRLYRLDPDRRLTVVLEDVGISNGLGFTPQRDRLYYIDTAVDTAWLFDYDETSGSIENRRCFHKFDGTTGRPDGLTVDSVGGVWIAMACGSRVAHFRPDGSEDEGVSLPTPCITSVAFGGEDFGQLFITSATEYCAKGSRDAGAVFVCERGTKGVPEFRSRIGL